MNKELEQRVRNNLGANILIKFDDQEREVGYHQIKLLKATEIIALEKKIEKNNAINVFGSNSL